MRTEPAIVFETPIQVALYVMELRGQISDGHWENASPNNHYRSMCDAEIRYEGQWKDEEAGIYNFTPARRYQFNSKPLLDVVSNRMLAYARLVKFGAPLDLIQSIEDVLLDLDGNVRTEIPSHCTGDYWAKKQKLMGLLDAEAIRAITTDDTLYSMKDLRSDLRSMSAIVNA